MENDSQNHATKKGAEPNSSVNISRRNFSRIGAAAPILMSLASPSALGAPCLSNMMSGHLYQDRGQCSPGWSPGGWKNVGGSEPDWNSTPFQYGIYDPKATYTQGGSGKKKKCGRNSKNQPECYVEGTTLSEALGYYGLGCPSGLVSVCHLPMATILNENPGGSTGNFAGHFVAALLNASHSGITYVITPSQLVGLYNDPSTIPEPYTGNIGSFLDSTW